jgi:hypothetical protein
MTPTFYQQFQDYFFAQRGQGLNTFGKHIGALKKFLGWAEDNGLAVRPKFAFISKPGLVDHIPLNERLRILVECVDWCHRRTDMQLLAVGIDKRQG